MRTGFVRGSATVFADQKLLIVGGYRLVEAVDRLRAGLRLSAVIHCVTRESDASSRCFAAAIQDPKLLLVIRLVALSRTEHGKQLRRFCRELEIPFVECKRIPQPHALLFQIDDLQLHDALLRRRERVERRRHQIDDRVRSAS